MEPLKEMFNKEFYEHLARETKRVHKSFNDKNFLKEVTIELPTLSLNQRMRKTSEVLHLHLPSDYKKTISILYEVIPNIKRGYVNLVFPDYVGMYGKHDFKTSLDALKYFTSFGSSEFAVREFLRADFEKTICVMKAWASDENHHVRRLSSEGSRPRLPWSFKLDEPIKNPFSTKEILDTLREDSELYVRKSVANHLNDISKDNPDALFAIVKQWNKNHKHTSWIIKHASRSLIKKGNQQSLQLFDFDKNPKIELVNFKLVKKKIKLGEKLNFSFQLKSTKSIAQKLVIDYAIHYKKSNGELSPKVFKLKEVNLKKAESISVAKGQLFKDFTTRKHFAGLHKVEIFINGKSHGIEVFYLTI